MIERFSLYNGEIELLVIFNNDKHEYRVKNAGEDDSAAVLVPGPTTALGVLDKPLLVPWASKMAVKDLGYYEKQNWTPDGYVRVPEEQQAKGFERMESILQRIKTMDSKEYWEALHQAKGAHRRGKEEAGDSGTLGHQFLEDYINLTSGKGAKTNMPQHP